MQCRHCETVNPDDNLFCEGCGTRFGGLAEAPAVEACACGTPLSEMDEDGFCSGCGRRLKRPDADHIEIELLPDFAGVSDRGLRHSRNEDRFAIAFENGNYGVVVCDGVSMSPDADEAAAAGSQAAIEALKRGFATPSAQVVRDAVAQAAAAITKLAEGKAEAPSATIVVALIAQNHLTVAWLGDSRAYWLSGGEAAQISRDHSWMNSPEAQQLGAAAQKSVNAHALMRWVGEDAPDLEPDLVELELQTSGTVLLCSDGLWNYAPDTQAMAALVNGANRKDASALSVARELVEFAREKGGHDNITAVILRHSVLEEHSHGG